MKAIALAIAILGLASFTAAQDRSQGGFSDTFVFDKNSQIISWDGSDPSAPPYPGDMGAVGLRTSFGGSYGSAIDAPFQLGYLNNGFLAPCDPLTLGPIVWTIGDGTNIGDTFTQYGATTCPYFTGEWGTYNNSNNRLDGFSVDATYTIVLGPRTCPRFKPCYYPHITVLTGGTGTITDTIITPICGNGIIESGEQCDDGNTTSGDGCSAQCQIESCFTCVGQPSICSPAPAGTACDDGNACTVGETCNGSGACGGFTSCRTNSTCNVCGQVCTQPQPGVCKCG